jgi:MFS family permease
MGAGAISDRLGRRRTIVVGATIFLIGGILQTSAMKIGQLMAGRFLAGLGVGFLTMIIPVYQAEIAHPSIRG